MNHKKGMSVLIADGMLVNTLPLEDFRTAMDAYAGVNSANLTEVTSKLLDAGINEYSGVMT